MDKTLETLTDIYGLYQDVCDKNGNPLDSPSPADLAWRDIVASKSGTRVDKEFLSGYIGTKIRLKGGIGSGFYGHVGRPGKRGGSAPSKSGNVHTIDGKRIPNELLPPISIGAARGIADYKTANDAMQSLLSVVGGDIDQIESYDEQVKELSKKQREARAKTGEYFADSESFYKIIEIRRLRGKLAKNVDKKIADWLTGMGVSNPIKIVVKETRSATLDEVKAVLSEYDRARAGGEKITREEAQRRAGIPYNVIVVGDGFDQFSDVQKDNIRECLNDLSTYLSSDLSADIDKGYARVQIAGFDGRAYFEDITNVIKISAYGDIKKTRSTLYHEFGHWMEFNVPGVKQRCSDFLNRRTAKESAKWLGAPYPKYEVVKKDKFLHRYIGKIYKDGSTEVLSCGLQAFFGNPVKFAKKDPEHFKLIVSIIRNIPEN